MKTKTNEYTVRKKLLQETELSIRVKTTENCMRFVCLFSFVSLRFVSFRSVSFRLVSSRLVSSRFLFFSLFVLFFVFYNKPKSGSKRTSERVFVLRDRSI